METKVEETSSGMGGASDLANGTNGGQGSPNPPSTEKKNMPVLAGIPKKKSKLLKVGRNLVIVAVIVGGARHMLTTTMEEAKSQMLASGYLSQAVELHEITVAVSSTGTVKPIDSYNVTALLTGDILSAPFEEGDIVTQGQLLFSFDTSNAVNSIQQAQLNLERAQLTYNQAVEAANPTATGAGIVQTVFVEVGETVAMGTPLLEISQNADRTVKIPFHSSQTTDIVVGQTATITIDQTMEQIQATVVSVSTIDTVGLGNVILRDVELKVTNPGAITTNTTATAQLTTGSGTYYSAASGTFGTNLTHTVTATYAGEITHLYAKQGDWVTYGSKIATIGGSAVENNMANQRLSVESNRLSLANAQDSLDNYTVTAPISGTVIEKKFKGGDTLDSTSLSAAGGNMAVIYDMSTLTFEMNIHELDINKILLGQKVEITADAVEGAEYTGYVDKISVSGSTSGGMTSYPITVVINDPEGLKPGMNVSANVIMESAGNVLSVPVDAVGRGEGGAYVERALEGALNENGMVVDGSLTERVYIELGVNNNEYIQVLSGLEEGDQVLWANEVTNQMQAMMGPRQG